MSTDFFLDKLCIFDFECSLKKAALNSCEKIEGRVYKYVEKNVILMRNLGNFLLVKILTEMPT